MARLLSFFFSFFLLSTVAAEVVFYENLPVQSLSVETGEGVPAKRDVREAIQARLRTRIGYPFSQTTFDEDLKSLALDFDWVEPRVEVVDGGLLLTLLVWEKPIIRSISFTGNHSVDECDLLEELDISTATVFDRNAFLKAFRKLKTFYVKMGYFEADVTYNIVRDPCEPEVDIEICVREGRSGRIKQIFFCGFDDCEMSDITDLMVTQKWNIFTGVFGNGGFYNEDMVQYDQFQIVNYLQNRGYADARVKIEVFQADKPQWLRVCITANRGERYHFGKVSYQGNCLFSDEIIEKLVMPEDGAVFSPDAVRDTITNLQDAYGIKGYIEAVIDDDLNLHDDKPIYDVHFTVEEGEPFRVGLIKVFGNNYTQTRVILHETLLRPGELFNTIKLRYTEERLRNIGYFKRVNVYSVRVSPDSCLGEGYRDIHIEVEEAPTGNLGAFMGLSSANDLFGGFNITEKNFRIAGFSPSSIKRFGWRGFKGAGEYAHFTATIGQKTNSYVLSWTKPYFFDTPWAVGVDLDRTFNGALSQDYDIVSYGVSLHAKRPLNAFVIGGLHSRIRNSTVRGDRNIDARSAQFDNEKGKEGLIVGIGGSLSYNSTNHPLRPTSGFHSRLDGELVATSRNNGFASLSYLNSLYHPFGSRGYIRLRGDFKFLQPFGIGPENTAPDRLLASIPLDERFFLGGDTQVRGYRPYAIGPKFTNTTDPQGGLSLVYLSLEYDWQLFSRADLFLFGDAGSLSPHPWEVNQLSCSAGFGAKLQVLDGAPPLVLGMGYPLNAQSRGDVKRFFISLGAKF